MNVLGVLAFSIIFIGTAYSVAISSPQRILVLGETDAIKETHSYFLDSLKTRGYTVTIRSADDSTLSLFKHGQPIFDHLLVLAPGVQAFGGSLDAEEIAKFIDNGGNVLVAGDSNIGNAIREFAASVGFEYDVSENYIIDHHNYDKSLDSGDHTTLVVPKSQMLNAQLITGDYGKFNPILFKGIGLVAGKSNRLSLSIVKGFGTSYSYNPKSSRATNPTIAGSKTLFVGGLQARNNARVILTGSVDMFSNKFFDAKVNSVNQAIQEKNVKSGNAEFVDAITKWLLKENGVLRIKNVSHNKVGETGVVPNEYTIFDEVEYKIEIEELKNGKWVPFNGNDVQMEFVRIDPFVRTTLANKRGTLSTSFKLPDVYGIFKFMVDYRRIGYTHLHNVQQIPVRPLWHTQYERFIRSAYPYYASSFSMMIGFLLFTVVFLYHRDNDDVKAIDKSKKKKN